MSRIRVDLVSPAFELPASTGGSIASWDFKGRAPLILFFPPSTSLPCQSFLLCLKKDINHYEEHQAKLLALLPAPLAECQRLARALKLPFPLLADTKGAVRRRYLDASPDFGLFVLDRYGEPYDHWLSEEADDLPPTQAILSALELAELECPECGVPEWS